MNRIRAFLEQLGGQGWVVILAMLIVVGGTWGFVGLLGEVREGETQGFDERILRAVGGYQGPPWLEEIGRDLTALGGVAVLTLVTLIVAGYLLIQQRYAAMVLVLAATVGGLLLSTLLKDLIHRDRPALVTHRSLVVSSSFPSGHSMLSAVVYLTLGSLLMRLVPGRLAKLYVLGVAMMLSFLVGVSRVYMGVHWPTDVLAGWTAGLVWALICWLVARVLQQRGAVQGDSSGLGT